jgi:hypothetical protein
MVTIVSVTLQGDELRSAGLAWVAEGGGALDDRLRIVIIGDCAAPQG